MKQFFQALGVLFILIGLYFLFAPAGVLGWLENNESAKWLYVSAIIGRFVLGLLLILAAKESRFPLYMKIFGYLLVIAAVVFMVIGHQTFQEFIASIMPIVKSYAPVTGLLVMVFGGFFVYAFSGKKE